MSPDLVRVSKFLSLVLRHRPDVIDLTLDANGWASIDELLSKAIAKGRRITREQLERAVAENDKQRFALNAERTHIRANQGHSVEVDLELEPLQPPELLYHGTATRFLDSILVQGLLPMSRQHVHLSLDQANMLEVAARHGKPILLIVRAGDMWRAGHEFYRSENGIWLTDAVPPAYLSVVN